jgi:hypothetical protein
MRRTGVEFRPDGAIYVTRSSFPPP